jgi:hypothetical protein
VGTKRREVTTVVHQTSPVSFTASCGSLCPHLLAGTMPHLVAEATNGWIVASLHELCSLNQKRPSREKTAPRILVPAERCPSLRTVELYQYGVQILSSSCSWYREVPIGGLLLQPCLGETFHEVTRSVVHSPKAFGAC